MPEFDNIDVNFIINSPEVARKSAEVKKSITGTDASVQKSAKNVAATVQRSYDQSAKEVTEFTQVVNKSSTAISNQGRAVAANRPKWDGMGHSINQLTREMPAFAVSTQIGILALSNNIPILADEIKNLKAQNQALVASNRKAIPIWKKISSALFGWMTLLSVGVTLMTIYGKEIGQFFKKLFKGKGIIDEVRESQKLLNKAFESTDYTRAVKDVLELETNIDLAKRGMIDASSVVDQYNESLGKATGSVDSLTEAEEQLIKNGDRYVHMMLYRAAANLALDESAKQVYESEIERRELEKELKVQIKSSSDVLSNINSSDIMRQSASARLANAQKRLRNFRKESKQAIEERNSLFKSLKEKAAGFGLDIFLDQGDSAQSKTAISNRQSLLDRLAALDKEYARKSFTRDEEEIQALKDKFDKMRLLVERYNKNNPKKAIDLAGLGATQSQAEKDLQFRQETKHLEKELNAKREQFQQFEQFKSQFGKEAAEERYKDEIAGFNSFSEFIQSKVKANQAAIDAVATGSASGGQTERATLLQRAAERETQTEQSRLDDLMARLLDFHEQKLSIEEIFLDKAQLIREKHQGAEAEKRIDLLRREKEAELNEIDEAAFKESAVYREMNERILDMTRDQIREKVRLLKDALSNGSFAATDGSLMELTREQTEELNRVIDELEKLLDSEAANTWIEGFELASNSLRELSSSLADVSPEMAEFLDTMSEVANIGVGAAKALAGFARFATGGDIKSGIEGTVQAIASIFRLIGKARQKRKEEREEYKALQREIAAGERELNRLQRERNIEAAKGIELTLERLKATKAELELSKEGIRKDYHELFNELNSGKFKYKNYFGNGRTLIGKTYEELKQLFTEGRLGKQGNTLFEQLQKLVEEGEDVEAMLEDLEQQWKEIWTGTTQESIADSIISGLRSGYTAVEDFAGDIEKLLQGAILNAIKYQVLQEPLQQLYDQFANFAKSDDELTGAEAEQIKTMYEALVGNALDAYNAFSGVLDQDAIANQSGLQGAIRRELTESTASELTGLYRATFDIQKQHLIVDQDRQRMDQENLSHTLKIMQSNAMIEANTANTVKELEKAVIELKDINSNTKPTSTGYDRGF